MRSVIRHKWASERTSACEPTGSTGAFLFMNCVFQAPPSTAFLYYIQNRAMAERGQNKSTVKWENQHCKNLARGRGSQRGGGIDIGKEGVGSGLCPTRLTSKGKYRQAKIEMFMRFWESFSNRKQISIISSVGDSECLGSWKHMGIPRTPFHMYTVHPKIQEKQSHTAACCKLPSQGPML